MTVAPLSAVPRPLRWLLPIALAAQLGWHATLPAPRATAIELPPLLERQALQALALGEQVAFAKLLMLWLQAFDQQPGVSVPFARLDYARLEQWLARILELDPRAQYPLLAASRVYGEVNDPERQRRMLRFVAAAFREDPERRWQWLAHAVFVAKHRLRDDALALQFATELATRTAPGTVPSWARQMRIFVLEDMGEIEAARVLLGALLASGEVTDPAEQRFLTQRLAAMPATATNAARGSP
ncbi:MAG: hypothetical protein IT494_00125 [Gammaproteobacteria bacterium]|nr:hypothetical protein [Gammaproteobacteria bacterium]